MTVGSIDETRKFGHLNVTVPDELELISLVIYTTTGIKNSLIVPLGTAQFRKLVDLTEKPKRKKTRESWMKIESMYWFTKA